MLLSNVIQSRTAPSETSPYRSVSKHLRFNLVIVWTIAINLFHSLLDTERVDRIFSKLTVTSEDDCDAAKQKCRAMHAQRLLLQHELTTKLFASVAVVERVASAQLINAGEEFVRNVVAVLALEELGVYIADCWYISSLNLALRLWHSLAIHIISAPCFSIKDKQRISSALVFLFFFCKWKTAS